MNPSPLQLDPPSRHGRDARLGVAALAVLTVLFPAGSFLLRYLYPWAVDPWAPRLMVGVVGAGVLVQSWRSPAFVRQQRAWVGITATGAAMVSLLLVWTNPSLPGYTAQLLLTVALGALVLRSPATVAWFWGGLGVAGVGATAWALATRGELPADDVLFLAVACAALFGLHVLAARQDEASLRSVADRTNLLRAIFDNATDAVILFDPVTNQTELVNARAVEMFEARSPDALRARQLSQLQTRGFTRKELDDIWRATDTGGEFRVEMQYHTFTGQPFWADVVYRPIDIAHRRLVLVRLDRIDERVQAKQALEAARDAAQKSTAARSEFLARMSHEIRTPLNGVLGLASLLEQTKLTEEQLAYVQTILTSGRNLRSLIDEILDFSSVEQGELTVQDEPFDIQACIDELQLLFRMQAVAKSLKLDLRIEPGVPQRVMVDGRRVRQVLVNLLGNALKFTEKGAVVLRVRSTTAPDRMLLRFEVVDTGIGIDTKVLPMLFEPFHQADPGISRRYGGTGLGLAISKGIADRMGGTLRAASHLGKGSQFTFDVPVRPAPIEISPVGVAAPEVTGPPKPRKVLIAEDNEVNVMVAAAMLRRLGCEVDIARNGGEAAERARQRTYDTVFMDVMMPDVDGLEATRRIRAMRLPRRPYIVALTAGVLPADRERCVAAGMDDFVPKPIQIEELRSALDRAERAARLYNTAP